MTTESSSISPSSSAAAAAKEDAVSSASAAASSISLPPNQFELEVRFLCLEDHEAVYHSENYGRPHTIRYQRLKG